MRASLAMTPRPQGEGDEGVQVHLLDLGQVPDPAIDAQDCVGDGVEEATRLTLREMQAEG